jgi:hypothetical protein
LRHWGIGVKGRIRTDGFRVLQTLALGLSATFTFFGESPGTRTPTNGFGDRRAAITPETQISTRCRNRTRLFNSVSS